MAGAESAQPRRLCRTNKNEVGPGPRPGRSIFPPRGYALSYRMPAVMPGRTSLTETMQKVSSRHAQPRRLCHTPVRDERQLWPVTTA